MVARHRATSCRLCEHYTEVTVYTLHPRALLFWLYPHFSIFRVQSSLFHESRFVQASHTLVVHARF